MTLGDSSHLPDPKAGPPGLFITGTDTGVGKTRVTCWLARELASRSLRLGLCKPVATGAMEVDGRRVWEDTEALRSVCPTPISEKLITPIHLLEPLAPNVAARRDPAWQGRTLSLLDYQQAIDAWSRRCELLLVEGVGGLLCPITDEETVADLAAWWGRPILIVARLGLGTLNHTLMTVEIARARGLDVLGVLINRSDPAPLTVSDETNPAEMRRLLDVPVWGPTPYQQPDDSLPNAIREVADAFMRRLVSTA
ncbi:dethiobiotin synthase [bacterium]|nr:dethiobiotin synthase [bacterium]